MSVRRCKKNDIETCIKIWKTCFPEDADFAEFYFGSVHSNADAFVYDTSDGVVGYLSAIPFKADAEGRELDCSYFCGISVLPDFRGMGYMRSLMKAALSETEGFKLLIPAVSGLYERFGFKCFTSKRCIEIDNPVGSLRECYDIKHLNEIYDFFRKRFDVSLKRDEKWWKIIIEAAKYDNYKIVANEGAYAFVCENSVRELAYVSDYFRDTLPIGRCNLKLPESMALGDLPFENNYLALMLD